MSKIYKPRIGVTGPDVGGGASWFFTAIGIWLAGGIPVRIHPGRPRTIEKLHGLIIGGGADIDPDTYEKDDYITQYIQHPVKGKKAPAFRRFMRSLQVVFLSFVLLIRKLLSRKVTHSLDKQRDNLEFNLMHEAVEKNIPILGICRGAQLINVFFRGNLYKEINPFYTEQINRSSIFPVKKVFFEPGSKLHKIYGRNDLWVNALHHQSVGEVGENIKVVAKEENGVVQAIESTVYPFIIGVQWHPEYLVNRKKHRQIFYALVKHAKETANAVLTKV